MGGLLMAALAVALGYGVWRGVAIQMQERRDFAEGYSGRVVDRGIESGPDEPQRFYLVIEDAAGQRVRRYCRFEGYARCQIGDEIVKPAGRNAIALPQGEKSARQLLEEAEKLYAPGAAPANLQQLKQHYTYE